MPPKIAEANTFTHREQQLMVFAWQSLDTDPKINTAKFAAMAGFTNVNAASNSWRAIRHKLGLMRKNDEANGTEVKSTRTPRSNNKKRVKNEVVEEGEDDQTSSKKACMRKKDKNIHMDMENKMHDEDYANNNYKNVNENNIDQEAETGMGAEVFDTPTRVRVKMEDA